MAVSTEDLERARALAARIVTEFGDRFLPLFEILDADYERRRTLSEKIDRAQKLRDRDFVLAEQRSSYSHSLDTACSLP